MLKAPLSDPDPVGTVRPELAYVLLLHFTFASGSGRAGHVGHAGCAEFSFYHSAEFFLSSFPQAGECQVQEQD